MDFPNIFYMTITGNFERFQYFDFSGKRKLFQKTGVPFSS